MILTQKVFNRDTDRIFQRIKIRKAKRNKFLSAFLHVSPTPEEETLADLDIFDNNFFVPEG